MNYSYEKIKKRFSYINELPVITAIISADAKEIIYSNQLFIDYFGEQKINFDKLPDADLSKTIINITKNNEEIEILTSCRLIDIDDDSVIICVFEDLNNADNYLFTSSSIKLSISPDDISENKKQEAIEACLSIINSSVRKTDKLIQVADSEYVIVFSKCRYDIVENIMMGMDKKFDVYNDLSDNEYSIKLEYIITEHREKKLSDFVSTFKQR